MTRESKELSVGADRFLALEWANQAFELYVSTRDMLLARDFLQVYLETQIDGKESRRKTYNQLNRLWLSDKDATAPLRSGILSFANIPFDIPLSVLHLGLAINVFPIYAETVQVVGTLARIMDSVPVNAIIDRVIERFSNPTSIPRAVTRVLQTLNNWGFIETQESKVKTLHMELVNEDLVSWYILAMLFSNPQSETTLQELDNNPFKLGINFLHPRKAIGNSNDLTLARNFQGLEVIRKK